MCRRGPDAVGLVAARSRHGSPSKKGLDVTSEGLVRYADRSTTIQPCLKSRPWETSADGRTWTLPQVVHIRCGRTAPTRRGGTASRGSGARGSRHADFGVGGKYPTWGYLGAGRGAVGDRGWWIMTIRFGVSKGKARLSREPSPASCWYAPTAGAGRPWTSSPPIAEQGRSARRAETRRDRRSSASTLPRRRAGLDRDRVLPRSPRAPRGFFELDLGARCTAWTEIPAEARCRPRSEAERGPRHGGGAGDDETSRISR